MADALPRDPGEPSIAIFAQGFVYERVQHITLKSIANNPDIKEGMTRDEIDAAIKRHAEFELLYDRAIRGGRRRSASPARSQSSR